LLGSSIEFSDTTHSLEPSALSTTRSLHAHLPAAGGVYSCRLVAGDFTQTRKVLLPT
jgi:hypothetical protein